MRRLIRIILDFISPKLAREIILWRFVHKVLPKDFVKHMRSLDEASLVIDLGANVGFVSECLARTGAKVIAFEPNKEALKKLRLVESNYKNISVEPYAAGIKNESAHLYLHRDTFTNDTDLTQSSSLKSDKPNVSPDLYDEVVEVDFAEYLRRIDRHIELIKIDIEGYEIELINHLIDTNVLDNVGKVYLETHDKLYPQLVVSTEELKNRIEKEGLSEKFFYEWH